MQGAYTLLVETPRQIRRPPIAVTWSALPHKPELLILFLCRLADFLQGASLQTYVFYQLKSFAPDLPNSTISSQVGLLHAAFPCVQIFTATIWGSLADSPSLGRKNVLILGLVGTGVSCLGLAFSATFTTALVCRIAGGAVNGTVGIIRTMVSEYAVEKRYVTRAILILPVSFYVAAIIGPGKQHPKLLELRDHVTSANSNEFEVLGGCLSNPHVQYPNLFGAGTLLGGNEGVRWMIKFPYALPAIVSSGFLFACAIVVYFGLQETLVIRKDSFDMNRIQRTVLFLRKRWSGHSKDEPLEEDSKFLVCDAESDVDLEESADNPNPAPPRTGEISSKYSQVGISGHLVYLKSIICHKHVLLTLLTEAFYDFHLGAFSSLLVIFLSSPRASSSNRFHGPFAQGLSFTTKDAEVALSLIGIIGLPIQLIVYPVIQSRLGTLRCYQIFATLFPLTYAIMPTLALLPENEAVFIWGVLFLFLVVHTVGRGFTLPATISLLGDCAPDASVLGFVHGVGQSVSAASRTIGSVAGGFLYAWGLRAHAVELSWWTVALVALTGCFFLIWLEEKPAPHVVTGEPNENA